MPLAFLILACAGGAPLSATEQPASVPPPSVPVTAPEQAPPFSCDSAPAALGKPDWSVYACNEMPEPPGLFAVTLESPDGARMGRMVPVNPDGFAATDAGMSAASAWLRARKLLGDPALTLSGLTNALEAFEAWPSPFGYSSRDFDVPGVGASSFAPEPFALTLFTLRDADHGGGPEVYLRAVLALDETSKLIWTLSEGVGGSFSERETIPAE